MNASLKASSTRIRRSRESRLQDLQEESRRRHDKIREEQQRILDENRAIPGFIRGYRSTHPQI